MNGQFSRTSLLLGEDGFSRLASARVAVIGLGGVGSYAVEALARAGIADLTIVDSDVVSSSNINRQLHALSTTVGLPKVSVMAERISLINRSAQITPMHMLVTPENVDGLLQQGFDLLLDAIDSFRAKIALIVACRTSGTPVISSMGAAGKLDLSRIRTGDISESRGCRLARKLRKQLRHEGISNGVTVVYSDEAFAMGGIGETPDVGETRRPMGSISYLPAGFGLAMAGEAIRMMLDGRHKNYPPYVE